MLRHARPRALATGLTIACAAIGAPSAGAAVGDLAQPPCPDGCVTVSGRLAPAPAPQGCAVALTGSLEAPVQPGAAISPDGRHLDVASQQVADPNGGVTSDGSLTVLERLPSGRLVPRSCIGTDVAQPLSGTACTLPASAGLNRIAAKATHVAVSPDGRNVDVAGSDGVGSFVRDTATGALAPAAPACHSRTATLGCASARLGAGPPPGS